MAPCLEMTPSLGIMKTSYLAIANKAPHPNAAKLFIKFALSPEGFRSLERAIGSYSGQPGCTVCAEGMPAFY